MLFILITGAVFIVEYFLKRHMDQVRTLQESRSLADGKIILKKYYNTGAAGNMLSDYPKWIRRMHTAAFTMVFASLLYLLPRKDMGAAKAGVSFLAGGGLSNLYDRLTKGYVIDYISFGFGPKRFRKLVFNTADFFIFAGIILCIVHVFKKEGEL